MGQQGRLSRVRDPGFFHLLTLPSTECGLLPHVPNGCWRSNPRIHIPRTQRAEGKKGSPSAFKDNFVALLLIDTRTQTNGHTQLQGKLTNVVCFQGEVCSDRREVHWKAVGNKYLMGKEQSLMQISSSLSH